MTDIPISIPPIELAAMCLWAKEASHQSRRPPNLEQI